MEFRTPVSLVPSPDKILLSHSVFSMGSCFAQVMGERLQVNKFSALTNPFGVLFNPVSMAKLLRLSITGKNLDSTGVIETAEGWRHYDLHSGIWADHPETLLQRGNQLLRQSQEVLLQADWLLLTLGTAFVYYRNEDNSLVANCHKVPAHQFRKELLSTNGILTEISPLLEQLNALNPKLRVILTVSPVRHTKDTLPLNAVSKSVLRLVCHELSTAFHWVHYFPAYEIMLDDLRDYRFYQPDMIHPSGVAEEYIWQQFGEMYFEEETRKFLREWGKLRQALAHRPLHPGTESHKSFLRKTIEKLQFLARQADMSEEIGTLQKQLNALS